MGIGWRSCQSKPGPSPHRRPRRLGGEDGTIRFWKRRFAAGRSRRMAQRVSSPSRRGDLASLGDDEMIRRWAHAPASGRGPVSDSPTILFEPAVKPVGWQNLTRFDLRWGWDHSVLFARRRVLASVNSMPRCGSGSPDGAAEPPCSMRMTNSRCARWPLFARGYWPWRPTAQYESRSRRHAPRSPIQPSQVVYSVSFSARTIWRPLASMSGSASGRRGSEAG
jgi:hypothetical protein